MTKMLLALLLTTGVAQAAATPRAAILAAQPQPFRVKMVRDFSLHFDHGLGAAEAKRRVMSRIENLRQKFGDKLEASDVNWNGNEADIRVKALSQSANGHISIDDESIDVRVHLPLLLSAFGDQIRAVLSKSALDALK